ncbi:MAG TPA: hypothetical protein VM425_12130 [Myxococcota bacterium]|nr:hypothetical protein [Myxococcota bacterium]
MSTAPPLATLPALPNPGDLANVQPVIVVDTRELLKNANELLKERREPMNPMMAENRMIARLDAHRRPTYLAPAEARAMCLSCRLPYLPSDCRRESCPAWKNRPVASAHRAQGNHRRRRGVGQ